MTAIGLAVISFFSTVLGGLFAIHQRHRLYLIMAFSAGVLVAAAFLDLLPEAIGLASQANGVPTGNVLVTAALGFLVFYGLERFVHMSAAGHDHGSSFGTVAALGLSVHSFLDGFAIGVAFRVNPTVGLIVAIAVIGHDFADGVSTVAIVLRSRGGLRAPLAWLLLDAAAPVIGAASALLIAVPEGTLAELLGFFAGSFLFIGGSHLLPESHQERKDPELMVAVLAGFIFLFLVTRVLGG